MSSSWLNTFREMGGEPAIFENDAVLSYSGLADSIAAAADEMAKNGIGPQSVVILNADFSRTGIAALFALVHLKAIVIPVVNMTSNVYDTLLQECGAQFMCRYAPGLCVERLSANAAPPALYDSLKERNASGLVLLSSGSTGKPKAILHNFDHLVEARTGKAGKRKLSIVLFLLFDHIGGINTLLNTLFSGGIAIVAPERTPEAICKLISRHRANVLPASPTFLNLLLMGRFHELSDLSSLRLITYGTEPMPQELLHRLRTAFPKVRLLQTFGTSETGIASTASESSKSTYFKIEGGDVSYRIVQGELQLKSSTQFLGYLNHPAGALTEDGWFQTGDLAEETGNGYIRILGRSKEIINVGGEKVLPVEVESALLQSPKVADCLVYGEANAITGQVVCADIVPREKLSKAELRQHLFEFLSGRVERFKIPSRINIVEEVARSERFKRRRTSQ